MRGSRQLPGLGLLPYNLHSLIPKIASAFATARRLTQRSIHVKCAQKPVFAWPPPVESWSMHAEASWSVAGTDGFKCCMRWEPIYRSHRPLSNRNLGGARVKLFTKYRAQQSRLGNPRLNLSSKIDLSSATP